MATTFSDGPTNFSMITINGEEYMPTPHEVNPDLPEDMVWNPWPPNELWLSDMEWYNALGQDQIKQRRIWGLPTEFDQVEAFRRLLNDHPTRALNMMFAAATKGKLHVVRFLLEQGVKGTANEADGDDMFLVPLHAAAYQGHLSCVQELIIEAKIDVNTVDDMGGTPLMRACWGSHPDIVKYLLTAGATPSIRQQPPEDHDLGANAFEFAVGACCMECARLVLDELVRKGENTVDLITEFALKGAAYSNSVEVLSLVLEIGGCPYMDSAGNWVGPALNDLTKDNIEYAFQRSLEAGKYNVVRPLFAYINDKDENKEYRWSRLKSDTIDSLKDGILNLSKKDEEEQREALNFLLDMFLDPNSRFVTSETEESKTELLNGIYYWAAQHGCLNTMKSIEGRTNNLNVNQLTRLISAPAYTTPLYTCAGSGHNHVVQYLLEKYGDQVDVHMGNGKFTNGPTAIWLTIWNGHTDTVRLLLEHGGGPVEYVDQSIEIQDGSKVIVAATKGFRNPVRLESEATWTEKHGAYSISHKVHKLEDEEGNEMRYVVLELEGSDAVWWNRIKLRKPDKDLIAAESDGRTLKEQPAVS